MELSEKLVGLGAFRTVEDAERFLAVTDAAAAEHAARLLAYAIHSGYEVRDPRGYFGRCLRDYRPPAKALPTTERESQAAYRPAAIAREPEPTDAERAERVAAIRRACVVGTGELPGHWSDLFAPRWERFRHG